MSIRRQRLYLLSSTGVYSENFPTLRPNELSIQTTSNVSVIPLVSLFVRLMHSAEQFPNHRPLLPCLLKLSTLPYLCLKLLLIRPPLLLPHNHHPLLPRKCHVSLNEPSELTASSASPAPYFPSQEVEYDDTISSLGSFYPTAQQAFVRQPVSLTILPCCVCRLFAPKLNYHLYTNPIPDAFSPSHFISDNLREELQRRSDLIHTIPSTPYHLPEELQGYHSLAPLEPLVPERRKLVSWYSAVYRATNTSDDVTYVLRRIESMSLSP